MKKKEKVMDAEVVKTENNSKKKKSSLKKESTEIKAFFSQRLLAFLLDAIIVSLIASFITALIPINDTAAKLYGEQTTIMENYLNQEISMEDYVNQMVDISYDISRQTVVLTIVNIVIYLIYYVIIPVYQNGQTLAKKLFKIRVKKCDDSLLSMNDMLFRSMINNSIFYNIICLCLIFFLNKTTYLSVNTFLSILQYGVLIISALMIGFTKSKQGLHDKLVGTEVVLANTRKEEIVCEN